MTHAFEQLLLCWSITCTPSQDRIMHGIVVLHHTVYFNCVQGVDTPCRQCYEMSYIATGSYTHIAKLVEQQEQQRWLTACMTTAEKANAAAAAIAWCPRACDSSNTFWQSSTNSSKIMAGRVCTCCQILQRVKQSVCARSKDRAGNGRQYMPTCMQILPVWLRTHPQAYGRVLIAV